jgi:hypothetical protein
MEKISFNDFEQVMTYDISKKQDLCIEIWFCIDDFLEYQSSWLGVMLDEDTHRPIYWYGLVDDGSQAYEFDSFGEFSNAKVFQGKSIKDIWKSVSIISLGGGEVQEMLPFFLKTRC